MKAMRSDFLQILHHRGFVQDCTDLVGLDNMLQREKQLAYIGFDCTANNLHVGSLIQIIMLRWLQKTGHKPIILLGGGTSKIGDPSGREEARQLLSDAEIAANKAGIEKTLANYLTFGEGECDAILVDNDEWLGQLGYISFLRDYGRFFSVNRMLGFESVKRRLERSQPLSFLEFNYSILQAYDFVELHRRYGCILQMGGSDQWGNIVSGTELGRRLGTDTLFGLTSPLLTTAGGSKMGKTATGAVWLSADGLSPYDFWQYWRDIADADVGRFLRLFTELPIDEIERLERLSGAEINEAKIRLANEVTGLAHGADNAARAEATARAAFSDAAKGEELPSVLLEAEKIPDEGIMLIRLFTMSGLVNSSKEAKRLIRDGGARVDGKVVQDMATLITKEQLEDTSVKLTAGRKRHALVRLLR